MAINTPSKLGQSTIYSVYLRNHSEEGNFQGFNKDLDRICDLGVDIIWFMPIHPIGEKNKKGNLGCPYSIRDYRGVNPEYGTVEGFKESIEIIHKKGMEVIIDVVFNHTSHDAVLRDTHPEFYYKKEDGSFGNKVGDWADIIDLDFENKGLWGYLIDTLEYWINLGVDGFRCDVSSLVPIDFWSKAREYCENLNPNLIWLGESIDLAFRSSLLKSNVLCSSDDESYRVFDALYDYDTFPFWQRYVKGEITSFEYFSKVEAQEKLYPKNYIKLRFFENHDQKRLADVVKDFHTRMNWIAFSFFSKGMTLLYAGVEFQDQQESSLFDKDLINFNKEKSIEEFIKKLTSFNKMINVNEYQYSLDYTSLEGFVSVKWNKSEQTPGKVKSYIGFFNFEKKIKLFPLDVTGLGINILNNTSVVLDGKYLEVGNEPIILEIS